MMATTEGKASSLLDAEAGIYTETLARLYLKQGFVERALLIYRRLAQEQPQNDVLQERVRTLEHDLTLGLLGSTPAAPTVATPDSTASAATARPCPSEQVVRQLEQWLHQLQRQRQASR